MKKTNALTASLLVLGFSVCAFAQARAEVVTKTQPARRTLYVSAWNTTLKLQAPQGMCFLDRTLAIQSKHWKRLKKIAERDHDQQMLAAFMKCDQIDSTGAWRHGAPDYGIVTWLDPAIGATTKMRREDYLDMREPYFLHYAAARFPHLTPEKTARRTVYDVSVALSGDDPGAGGDPGIAYPSAAVIATTTLRRVPVEFTLHFGGKNAPDNAALDSIADRMARQLILLNP